MTPEERARKAVTEWRFMYGDASGGYDDEALENGIAAAIRAAVEAERQSAYDRAREVYISGADEGDASELGRAMLRAIRNTNAPRDAER